jgi:glycosyltransferase involved in cell wall biosynthesis
MKISIIIPTHNDEYDLRAQIAYLKSHRKADMFEIIVVDGDSSDKTLSTIEDFDDIMIIQSGRCSKSYQMNLGAKRASADTLCFLNPDVSLPHAFYEQIVQASKSYDIGGFTYMHDRSGFIAKILFHLTRLKAASCCFGAQTMFVDRRHFEDIGGFNETMDVYEDIDLVQRSTKRKKYKTITERIITPVVGYPLFTAWMMYMKMSKSQSQSTAVNRPAARGVETSFDESNTLAKSAS